MRVSSFLAQTMTVSLSAKANVANDVILKELLVSDFDTVQNFVSIQTFYSVNSEIREYTVFIIQARNAVLI